MVKTLFVCTGNICRSPTAEGIFRHLVNQAGLSENIEIDSAGIHSYHIGESPDPRSISTAAKHGVDLTDLVARKITQDDFHYFDFILAMDNSHSNALKELKPQDSQSHVALFLEHVGHLNASEVPDPYYGNQSDFDHCYNLIFEGVQQLFKKISIYANGSSV